MIDEFVSNLNIDLSLTINIIIGIVLVFFGITQDTQLKSFKLKNTLILYISLAIIIIFLDSPVNIILLLIIGFFAGGFILLNDEEDGLEKELNKFDLLMYSSLSWVFLNKTYIWFLCGILILILNACFSIQDNFILLIILGFSVYHYLSVSVDIFGFKKFEEVREKLDISVKKFPDYLSRNYEVPYNHLLAFLVFMEDRNMFRRKSNKITFRTDFIKIKKYKEKLQRVFDGVKFNNHTTIRDRLKNLNRGYSTIEQQIIRNIAMKDNTYRYTVRRKNYIEKIYLYYFVKALCKRKARSLTTNRGMRKYYREKLKINLKYLFLSYYYTNILNYPENKENLIEEMAKQSRVSSNLYKRIYCRFDNSVLQRYHSLQVERAKNTDPRF